MGPLFINKLSATGDVSFPQVVTMAVWRRFGEEAETRDA